MSAAARLSKSGAALLSALAASGCSVGDGEGVVRSDRLYAEDCWDDAYDLEPDFFAADPFRETMTIRVQRGSELEEVSDGLSVLITDVPLIRETLLGVENGIQVTLPPGVAPPGVAPGQQCGGGPCPKSPVHMALYLQESCHNQGTVLYGLDGFITFQHLFSGDPNEQDAAEKLIEASFEILVGDPRVTTIGLENRSPTTNVVTGNFRFYFERGQPAQAFP